MNQLGIPSGKQGWHTGRFFLGNGDMKQMDENGAATLLELRGLDDPQEQRQLRLKTEIAIARLLMKIHNDEVNDLQAREELVAILAKWQGATPEDIREAHEDVEATLAQKHNDKQDLG